MVGGNYVWWLVIVVIFMGLGGAKRVGEGAGEVLKSSRGGRGVTFMGGVDLSRYHVHEN